MDYPEVKPRKYAKGIGKAVADRTINRKTLRKFKRPKVMKIDLDMTGYFDVDDAIKNWCKVNEYELNKYELVGKPNGVAHVKVSLNGVYEVEEWEDVAERVSYGNSNLIRLSNYSKEPIASRVHEQNEFNALRYHIRKATLLMSGRHLQHGDATQPDRNMEVFTNCSTATTSFISFYLLLNGSGVGRAYDDDLMVVDWSEMPTIVTVIDSNHPDVKSGEINALDRRSAEHLYKHRKIDIFEVPDSREGWAYAVELIETSAYQGIYEDSVLLIDFSKVRCRGSKIGGMQNRPASGPAPLMAAINNVAKIKYAGMEPWRQAMYVDHYLAECVLVGGARRAARMSTKTWRDKSVLDFIEIKRGGFLWSSNNSVTVDGEFWKYNQEEVDLTRTELIETHAHQVLNLLASCAYHDGTGEPGIINQDKLVENRTGLDKYAGMKYISSSKYKISEDAERGLMKELASRVSKSKYIMITNPCGEIALNMLGGYCVIADVVPYHASTLDEAEDAFRVATRALIRVNLMDSLYKKEVERTNRIGVSITGLHEFAWKFFGYGWKDIVDETKSKDLWLALARFKMAVAEEAQSYSLTLGVTIPHTNTTIKPAGTTSKLFDLTEGAHLPSMREYIRWVQFRFDDPLVKQYEELGYPIKKLKDYQGTVIVGFPTQPGICKLGMGDKLVIAPEATPEEQYEYLRLLEKYYIVGIDTMGNIPADMGNQVSYTLKYDPKVVSFEEFKRTLIKHQSTIKCCSVMPQTNMEDNPYEYLPEHPVTKHEYEAIVNAIMDDDIKEDVGVEHVDCAGGACPIDFNRNSAARA